MSVQVKHRRDTAANIATFTPAQGEIIVDTTNNRMICGDGSVAGGYPAAKLSEIPVAPSAHGATAQLEWIEQLITCSGATTAIPLGATVVIYAVALPQSSLSVTACEARPKSSAVPSCSAAVTGPSVPAPDGV